MREIKFRAWNGFEMYFPDNIYKDGSTFRVEENALGPGMDVVGGDDQPVLMQFTGLKDSKGVEIFEGDILRINGGGGDIFAAIGFQEGCFVLEGPWADQRNYPELKYYIGMTFIEKWEVCGNVHQNPELLTKAASEAKG